MDKDQLSKYVNELFSLLRISFENDEFDYRMLDLCEKALLYKILFDEGPNVELTGGALAPSSEVRAMLNKVLERMVKDAGFKVFGEKIVAADDHASGLATHCAKRLVEIVRNECADEIERISGETYAVLLCEHKEAADWLRANV